MKHLGDITKIDGHNVPLVDIITGGSPCQDLSVAGKRAGLEGARSGLFMEQIRITKELRNESIKQLRLRGADFDIRSIQPRYFVWENVPGAFSSNKGEDFRAVLEETAKIVCEDAVIPRPENGKWTPSGVILGDGWSIAWRVHDAQFWGVPQRRKRIALVADFGGDTAPKILFESEGLSGDSETSREEGQGASSIAERDIDPSSYTLKIRGGVEVDSHGKKAGKGPLIQTELSGIYKAETTRTLDNNGGNPACNQGGMMVLDGFNLKENEELSPTLTCQRVDTKNVPIVLEGNEQRDSHKGDGYKESETMYTLNTVEQHGVCTYQQTTGALTPGAHPGSYNGQDAYNDMLVVDKSPKTVTYGVDCYNQTQSKEVTKSLNAAATDSDHIPCVYGLDRASFNQGQNAQYDFSVTEEQAQTLVSRGPGGVLSRQSVPYVQEITKE